MARTWLKLDDSMVEHPKCVDLTPFAWTLWLHAISYCSRNLTDGLIPQAMLPRLCSVNDPAKAAAELVDAGLWRVTGDGYQVHDYLDHQRSRAEVEADRTAAAERQRRSRERRGAAQQEDVTDVSHRDKPVSHGVSHGTVTPQESVSVSAGVVNTSTDGLTTRDGEPVDFAAAGRVKKLGSLVRGQAVTRFGRQQADGMVGAAIADLPRLVKRYPGAPDSMLVAKCLGEQTPHLGHYDNHATGGSR